jgi:hypothetical protein
MEYETIGYGFVGLAGYFFLLSCVAFCTEKAFGATLVLMEALGLALAGWMLMG